MSLSLRQLSYFVAVAEAGQISAAARELYVTQSAVTTAVRDLEASLRQPLLTRNSRGVALTEAGLAFLPKARSILQMVQEAQTLTVPDDAVRGALKIGVTYTVMGYFVPTHVPRLQARYPRLQITWLERERGLIESQLLSGELDLGLLITSNVQSPDLRRMTFVQSPRRLWLAQSHELRHHHEVDLATIADHPYVMLTVDEADDTTLAYWGTRRPRVLLRTTAVEAARSLVANGSGVTILSDMVYRPWSLEGRRIQTAEIVDGVPSMDVGLVWPKGTEFTPAMSAIYDYFHQEFLSPRPASRTTR
ncbi:MAG: LysR family transcriptional regulator [Dermatophilaceae bacterium]|nr:LysR family transcriptional regulator [Dermatophilaceae bacterium]MBU9943216.1 LysR family transcriptional regulator [Dermatophilaceae bacterium]